jgi:hypothetical protein
LWPVRVSESVRRTASVPASRSTSSHLRPSNSPSLDWRRWGSRGGQETVRRYGSSWMALLALRRWGRISATELDAARKLR